MEDRESLKEILTDAGFSKYEAEVYLSVLELTDASVADIAEVSPVPRSRVYDVLRNLKREGYLETYERGSLRARIRDPSAVVETLTERSRDFAEAADGIEETWEQPQITQNSVRVFQEHESVIAHARQQLAEAKNIVHLAVSPDELNAISDSLKTLRERGVVVQIVLHEGSDGFEGPAAFDSLYPDVATEVRFCASLLPFIVLIDGDLTILGVQSQRGREYGMVVKYHVLSSILHWYFQIQLWEPWDVVYSSSEVDEMTYVSIRELIRDLESVRDTGETVTVRVKGIETLTGDRVTITGEVNDIMYVDSNAATDQPFRQPFIQAAIVVTDESRDYTIGGYGAILEDIRATRITILSVE
ncbi:TrmB family transcriptional regulator [Halomarina halobia]|uniref:TrmB family transcriptional regulator n=1 Tax=Halomarina halobia TaxID=3033386 RepID=A0ABD6ADJ7_9EURY|nr:TrmB family transcriptional regulator [Halomarina sp. PSR21]